jgi:chitodextrinase
MVEKNDPRGYSLKEIEVYGSYDVEAPAVPENLSVFILSDSRVRISWNKASDNLFVKGYTVYRNDTAIGTTAENSYADTMLLPGTTYRYAVSAFDSSGNV